MKKVLILGGAGFIGGALINQLKKNSVEITAVDRAWNDEPNGVNCIVGDVFDKDCLNQVMAKQDVVYHLVSTTLPASSNKSPLHDCESNVAGTLRILDAMVENDIRKIVFLSSGGTVYGITSTSPINESFPTFPISAYGIGKLAIEKYLYLYSRLHGISAPVIRLSNPFGPGQAPDRGQGVIATFVKRALQKEPIEIWGDGSVIRDFVYIDDVIASLILSANSSEAFSLFNVGMGEGRSILDILDAIEKEVGCELTVIFKKARLCDVPEVVLDISKINAELNWYPRTSFEEGIKKTISDMRSLRTEA